MTSTLAVGRVVTFARRQQLLLLLCSNAHCDFPSNEDNHFLSRFAVLHLLHDSHPLGRVPSAPVCCCHWVSQTHGRLTFEQEAVLVFLFLLDLCFHRSTNSSGYNAVRSKITTSCCVVFDSLVCRLRLIVFLLVHQCFSPASCGHHRAACAVVGEVSGVVGSQLSVPRSGREGVHQHPHPRHGHCGPKLARRTPGGLS